jgi:hypothetical protein
MHHPLRHPRNAAIVGITFVIVGIIFYAVPTMQGLPVLSVEVAAGTTLLLFLGVAMSIMAYVLIAGSTDE